MSVTQSKTRQVMLRQDGILRGDVKVPAIVQEIKRGELKPTDEISGDGLTWYTLGEHPQLSKMFGPDVATPPPASKPPVVKKKKKKSGALANRQVQVRAALAVLGLALGAAIYLLPYWSVYRFQMALEKGDAGELAEVVDFSALRLDIRNQINIKMVDALADQVKSEPNRRVDLTEVQAQTDEKVDELVNRESLLEWSQGRHDSSGAGADTEDAKPEGETQPQAASPAPDSFAIFMDVFSNSRISFDSFSRFVETLNHGQASKVDFVYEQRGLTWQVTGMQVSDEEMDTIVREIGESALTGIRRKPVAKTAPKPVVQVDKAREEAQRLAEERQRRAEELKRAQEEARKRQEEARRMAEVKGYLGRVRMFDFRVGRVAAAANSPQQTAVYGTLLNEGDRTLNEVKLTLFFLDRDGNVMGTKEYYPVSTTRYMLGRDNDPLLPNRDKDFGFFVDRDAPQGWAGNTRAEVTDLLFAKEAPKAPEPKPAPRKKR